MALNTLGKKPKGKPRGKGKPFVTGDPRINKGGRPKGQESVTAWLHVWANMSPAKAAKLATAYAKELLKAESGGLPIAALVALRILMDIMNTPAESSRLFATVMDRLEGKLPTTIRTWRDELIDAIKNGEIAYEAAADVFGPDLATELFVGAGVPIASGRVSQKADAGTGKGD